MDQRHNQSVDRVTDDLLSDEEKLQNQRVKRRNVAVNPPAIHSKLVEASLKGNCRRKVMKTSEGTSASAGYGVFSILNQEVARTHDSAMKSLLEEMQQVVEELKKLKEQQNNREEATKSSLDKFVFMSDEKFAKFTTLYNLVCQMRKSLLTSTAKEAKIQPIFGSFRSAEQDAENDFVAKIIKDVQLTQQLLKSQCEYIAPKEDGYFLMEDLRWSRSISSDPPSWRDAFKSVEKLRTEMSNYIAWRNEKRKSIIKAEPTQDTSQAASMNSSLASFDSSQSFSPRFSSSTVSQSSPAPIQRKKRELNEEVNSSSSGTPRVIKQAKRTFISCSMDEPMEID